MTRRNDRWVARTALMALLGLGTLVCAAEEPRELRWQELPEAPRHGEFVGEAGISIAAMTDGFLAAHPDIRWRREALHSYSNQRHEEAMVYFRRAALHADKASQAMIAEMYWNGLGVPQDRVMGYVWMDLAAERLYPNFTILRERYWAELDQAQQDEAIERGQAVYAEFGDDVAQPRLDRILRRERRRITGSRVGFTGNLTIIPNTGPLAEAGMTISGEEFYAKKYWDPVEYRALQDSIWKNPPTPQVEVGTLRQGGDDD